MNEECLICKAPLEYLDTDEVMECELCHKKQSSKTRCINGHFVCDECHTSGMDEIISICFNSKAINPLEIMEEMMSMPSCHITFSAYLILLIWLVLFKFATSFSEIPSMRSINLIPFYYNQGTNTQMREVLYNIVVFVPLGVYVQIFKEEWKIAKKCMVVFLTSFLFEVLQFIFAIGASDVTDLIGNTLGGIVGILFCITLKKITPKKYISIINGIGLFIELAGIGLMLLLFIANR